MKLRLFPNGHHSALEDTIALFMLLALNAAVATPLCYFLGVPLLIGLVLVLLVSSLTGGSIMAQGRAPGSAIRGTCWVVGGTVLAFAVAYAIGQGLLN